MESKNTDLLKSFTDYCLEHPQERFWQALRNWAKVGFIYTSEAASATDKLHDTFYDE